MKYLLIAFVVAMVLSPIFWLRQSPGQARITAFRNRALQLGLKVQIVPSAEAAESERRPDAVRYLRPFMPDHSGNMPLVTPPWILLRGGRRGWESPWPQWRWFRREATAALHNGIGDCLALLPASVTALRLDDQGLSAYWAETGKIDDVALLADALDRLFQGLSSVDSSSGITANRGAAMGSQD